MSAARHGPLNIALCALCALDVESKQVGQSLPGAEAFVGGMRSAEIVSVDERAHGAGSFVG